MHTHRLQQDPEFRNATTRRWQELRNGSLSNAWFGARIDNATRAIYPDAVMRNYGRRAGAGQGRAASGRRRGRYAPSEHQAHAVAGPLLSDAHPLLAAGGATSCGCRATATPRMPRTLRAT
jgi:hypothetical protein